MVKNKIDNEPPTRWAALVRDQCEWDKAGYQQISLENLYGIPVIVKDFETFESQFGDTVRVLVEHPSEKDENGDPKLVHFITGATLAVRAFNNPNVQELIDERVPVTFKVSTTVNGKVQYLSLS